MKRIISAALAVLLCLLALPVGSLAANNGSCGAGILWSVNGYTLNIDGKGTMENYERGSATPWAEHNSQIRKIIVSEGVSYLGSNAFAEIENLAIVVLPRSVMSCGETLFYKSMTNLTIYCFADSFANRYAAEHKIRVHNHSFDQFIQIIAPTCESTGIEERHCTLAGCPVKIDERTIDKLGHDFALAETYTAATCTAEGEGKFVCQREGCNAEKTDKIPMLEHNKVLKQTVDPTCTEDGYMLYECSSCDYSERLITIYAKGHSLDEGRENPPASCTTEGKMEFSCSVCKQVVRSEVIAAKGHKFSQDIKEIKAASCTEGGEVELFCTECKESVKQKTAAKGHALPASADFIIKPSCTEAGLRGRACANCDFVADSISVEPLGHAIAEDFVYDVKLCTEGGIKYKPCLRCDARFEETQVPAGEHNFSTEYSIIQPAECTKSGKEAQRCRICEAYQNEREIKALGHDYDYSFSIDKPATCTAEGEQSRHCLRCDARINIKPIVKKGHEWKQVEIRRYPDCQNTGEAFEVCEQCMTGRVRELPRTEHSPSPDIKETHAPTCTQEGYSLRACLLCKEDFKSDIVPATGHNYGTSTRKIDASCTQDGSITRMCTVCGESDRMVLPALGHSFGAWRVTEESDILHQGGRARSCARCNETQTEDLPAIPTGKIVDPLTGIAVVYQKELYKGKLSLSVKNVTEQSSSLFKKEPAGLVALYSVELFEDGRLISDGSQMAVFIPIGIIKAGSARAVFVDKTGYVKEEDSFVEENELIFKTERLGHFALVNAGSNPGRLDLVRGDVDGNGRLTAADARLALRISARLEEASYERLQRGDLNGDGRITAAEARSILRAAADLATL